MSSSFQFSVTAGFKAVDRLQQTIIANAAGLLKPGYNRQRTHLGQMSGNQVEGPQDPTLYTGGRSSLAGGGDTLSVGRTSIDFEQGTIEPAFNPTSLAIRGDGFFLVAENDLPGAQTFLTRNGTFSFDAQGRLVNEQGMFVLGGSGQAQLDANGRTIGPPPFVRALADGTVPLPDLTLGRVGARAELQISGYGDTIYRATAASGRVQTFANGAPQVGFVQSSSIEIPNRYGVAALFSTETNTAIQTYKIFKDMLTEFNKTTDDTINLVK